MLDQLQVNDFIPYINQLFTLQVDGLGELSCTLVEANTLGSPPPEGSGERHSFSIILRGPGHPILPQQIYRLQHKLLGQMDIFLVPLGPDTEGIRYEAVFT